MLSLCFVLVGCAAWLLKTNKRLNFLNPDLAITKFLEIYDCTNTKIYFFQKSVSVRALRSGIDNYKTKFRWSGVGSVKIHIDPENEFSFAHSKTSDDWDLVRIQFPEPLMKNQVLTFELRFIFNADHCSPRPFLQKYIDDFYPNGLTTRAVLPGKPRWSKKEIFLTPRTELPLWAGPAGQSGTPCQIAWTIRKPLFGRRYRLTWGEQL